MRPCFAAVRSGGERMVDQIATDQLKEAKADHDSARTLKIMGQRRDSHASVTGGAVEPVKVTEEPTTTLPADIDF